MIIAAVLSHGYAQDLDQPDRRHLILLLRAEDFQSDNVCLVVLCAQGIS
jgi:hypothetical protein